MLTREQICEEYEVDSDGIITSPGQFEGERVYVPYFWESNDGEEVDDREFVYTVCEMDRDEFPELDGVTVVRLYVSETGFICEMNVPNTIGA